ncbi:CPBP family intramembrane glutamic endopeptidase [Chloroflexus aurantiacus]
MLTNPYLALADQGKNAWWRYVLGVFLILTIWMLGTGLMVFPFQQDNNTAIDSVLEYAVFLLTFGLILFGVWLVTIWLHRRPFGSLIGATGRLNGRRLLLGAAIWGGLLIIFVVLPNVLFAGSYYVYNPDFVNKWPYVLVALLLIPLQISAEEFFFRGYLLQAGGRLVKNWFVLSFINGVLFTLPHLANAEAEGQVLLASLNWFLSGAGWTLITLRSGSLDYALGMHAINNLFLTIVFGYESRDFPSFALFMSPPPQLDVLGLVTLFIAMAVSYWIIDRIEARSEPQAVRATSS